MDTLHTLEIAYDSEIQNEEDKRSAIVWKAFNGDAGAVSSELRNSPTSSREKTVKAKVETAPQTRAANNDMRSVSLVRS